MRLLLPSLLVLSLAIPAAAQPGEAARPIRLQNATAEQAFAALGDAFNCTFQPVEPQWQGEDLSLSHTLPAGTFWEMATRVGQITGYEPVFTPYETAPAPDSRPVITLRRVDVRAEEEPDWGAVAGPLLVRAGRAFFSIDLDTARRRLVPLQVTIDLEVFAAPTDPPLAVTATAARGRDVDNRPLVKAQAYDSTASIVDGIGTLQAVFDTPGGIPGGVTHVDAMLRIVHADRAERFTLTPQQLTASSDDQEPGAAGDEDLLDWGGFRGRVDGVQSNEERDRIAMGLRFLRGQTEAVQWRAFYAALQGLSPSLTQGWQERGKLIVASGEEADGTGLAREYVIVLLASHPRPPAPLPEVTLEMATRFRESRARVTLDLRLPIEASDVPSTRATTGPVTQPLPPSP